MRKLLIVVAIFALSGCRSADYAEADGKILCSPDTGKAYFMASNGFGNATFVTRVPSADAICAAGKEVE